MTVRPEVGEVLHWTNFRFPDGGVRNKFFVVLSAKAGQNWLFVLATSKPRGREYVPGCDHENGHYHIPGGRKDHFERDTWLLLMRCVEIDPIRASKLFQNGTLSTTGQLRADVAEAIRQCLKNCEDVPTALLRLL